MTDLLQGLVQTNLAAAAAILLVLLLRDPIRRRAGAHAAYLMWAIVPIAMLATLIPARVGEAVTINYAPLPAVADPAPVAEETPTAATTPLVQPSNVEPAAIDWPALARTVPLYIWLAGVIVMLIWMARRQWQFLGDVRRGLAGPAVAGVLRPRIVTPADFRDRYSEEEQALILEHEKVHLRRGDALVNFGVAVLRCLCWFNPLVQLSGRWLRIDQELSCDAAVIERRPEARHAYAQTLLKTQLASRPLPLGCYWPAGKEHPLGMRIEMLAQSPASHRRRLAAGAAILALAAAGGCAAWSLQPERPGPVVQRDAEPEQLAERSASMKELRDAMVAGNTEATKALLQQSEDREAEVEKIRAEQRVMVEQKAAVLDGAPQVQPAPSPQQGAANQSLPLAVEELRLKLNEQRAKVEEAEAAADMARENLSAGRQAWDTGRVDKLQVLVLEHALDRQMLQKQIELLKLQLETQRLQDVEQQARNGASPIDTSLPVAEAETSVAEQRLRNQQAHADLKLAQDRLAFSRTVFDNGGPGVDRARLRQLEAVVENHMRQRLLAADQLALALARLAELELRKQRETGLVR
jgi:beta-lactamase regulating signal transducer with metallopeptidase domain